MDTRRVGAFVIGTCVCFAAHAQTLFKCVQPNGKIVYQDSKCADDAKQSSVRIDAPATPAPDAPAAPGAKAEGKADGKKAEPKPDLAAEMASVIEVLANFQACADTVPGFVGKYGVAMTHWKQAYKEALIRYGQSETAQRKMMKSLEDQRQEAGASDDDARAKFAAKCDQQVGPQTAAAAAR